jgi:hypothetical protein
MELLVDDRLQRAELESNGLAEHLFERLRVPVRSPELQFGVAGCPESRDEVIRARIEIE